MELSCLLFADALAAFSKVLGFAAHGTFPRIVAEDWKNLLLQEALAGQTAEMAAAAIGTGMVLGGGATFY